MRSYSSSFSRVTGIILLLTLGYFSLNAEYARSFRDVFDGYVNSSELTNSAYWSVYGISGDPENRLELILEGDPSPYLKLLHSGNSAVLQLVARDAWAESAPSVVSVSFSFVHLPEHKDTRFTLRAGQNRAFSSDRVHEVRFSEGRINNRQFDYDGKRRNWVTAVFNNSSDTVLYAEGDRQLAADSLDLWINGELVLQNEQHLRGGLPLGESLNTVSFDLPAGMPQQLLIGQLRVEEGAISPDDDWDLVRVRDGYGDWASAKGLEGSAADPMAIPEGGKLSNLLRYAVGVEDGENERSFYPEVSFDSAGLASPILGFVLRRDLSDVDVRVQYSSNLNDWRDVGLSAITFEDGPDSDLLLARAAVVPDSNEALFVRLVADVVTDAESPEAAYQAWAETYSGLATVLPNADWLAGNKTGNLVILPPALKLSEEYRQPLDQHLASGGTVLYAGSRAINYDPQIRQPVRVFNPGQTSYTLRRPTSSQVNPEAVVTESVYSDDEIGGEALRIQTQLIGDGNVLVEIPLADYASSDRSVLRFWAKGEYDMDILYLVIRDIDGNDWTGFAQLDNGWRKVTMSFADFLRNDGFSGKMDPENVQWIRMGIGRFTVWPEVQGAFTLGPVEIGEASESDMVRSGDLYNWRVQFARYGIDVSPIYRDPLWHSIRKPGLFLSENSFIQNSGSIISAPMDPPVLVPSPAAERGREDTELWQIMARDRYFSRSVFSLVDRETAKVAGSGGEIRYWLNDLYPGATEIILPNAPIDPKRSQVLQSKLDEVVVGVIELPHIRNIEAQTFAFSNPDDRLRIAVTVRNPSTNSVAGGLRLSIPEIGYESSRDINFPASSELTFNLFVDSVEASFPFERFSWSVELTGASGNEVFDSYTEDVDIERTLANSSRYFLGLIEKHRGPRMSHHFFADKYAVRFLFQYARHLEENPEAWERVSDILVGYQPQDLRNAALAWIDDLTEKQSEDGSFPMGYGEHRGVRFLGDLGQIAFGIAQLTSWLDTSDSRRERYLDFIADFIEFRESLYIDQEKAARLEAEFGPNPETITPGFYGMGLLDSDYFEGGSFPGGLQLEERGRWWKVPLTMAGPAAMSAITADSYFKHIAIRDIEFYLDQDFPSINYFHIEALLWMDYTVADTDLRLRIRNKASEFVPSTLNGNTFDGLRVQGREVLRLLSLLYYERYIESSQRHRAFMLQNLINMNMTASSNSLSAMEEKYPRTSYGPSIGAYRYNAYAAIWMLELMLEGSTLLKGQQFPASH